MYNVMLYYIVSQDARQVQAVPRSARGGVLSYYYYYSCYKDDYYLSYIILYTIC